MNEIEIYDDSRPNLSPNKFWLVWNPIGHSPRYRHQSEEAARAEAKRLARQAPTEHFIVLEAIARYEAAPPVDTVELIELPAGGQIGEATDE